MLMTWNWLVRKRTWLKDGRCYVLSWTLSLRLIWDSIWDAFWARDLPNFMMVPRYQLWPTTWRVCWKLSVERYLDIVGKDTKLKHVSTPSLPEETKKHKSRAPCPGDPKKKVACPWCSHEFDPDAPEFYKPGDHRGRRLPWGVCTRRLGATCCQRAHEVALTLPGSHGSTCYGLWILWPGMWPNGQSTMMLNCII